MSLKIHEWIGQMENLYLSSIKEGKEHIRISINLLVLINFVKKK